MTTVHPLWRPFAPTASRDRQDQRVAVRQIPPGPLACRHTAWAADYRVLQTILQETLAHRILAIDHVGSTAVPGVAAKPIVDIDLTVFDVLREEDYLPALRAAEFRLLFRDEMAGDPHRQLSYAAPNANLHVWNSGAIEPQRHLMFVEWLRDHPADRDRYAAAKRAAYRSAGDGIAYNDAKAATVYDIYESAFAADPHFHHDPQPRPQPATNRTDSTRRRERTAPDEEEPTWPERATPRDG